MGKTKVLAGAVAFAAALAVPAWTVSGTATSSSSSDAAAGSAAEPAGAPAQQPAASASGAAGHGGEAHDWRAMDAQMAKRDKSFPAPTKGEGGQILEPKVLDDGTKEFQLTAKAVKWEVEPGKVVDAWTYNGTVPGPTLKVDVGDKVRVVFNNELPESTVIHWHGLPVPNEMDGVSNITQDPVTPGGTFTYTFSADEAAVGWFHSHHNGTKQVTSGLFATFLIGEMPAPDGVKVSQSLPMVIQDAGPIGMSINGKSFPATKPVEVKLGDWVEIHYVNAGTMNHPMHLHGMPQLVIAKDGFPLAEPYKADTVDVAPGERYTVLVHVTKPGKWAWHCHIFPHSEGSQGMFGIFTELHTT